MLLLVSLLAIFNTSYQSQPHGENHIIKFVQIPGTLTAMVEENEYNSRSKYQEVLVSAKYFQEKGQDYTVIVKGKILLRIYSEEAYLHYGDLISADLILKEPGLPNNFGEFNYRDYLIRQKIFTVADIDISQVELLNRKREISLQYFLNLLKNRTENHIDTIYSYPNNLFMKAIITGNRKGMPEQWEEIFQDTGIMHILAISGLHVGIIMSALFFLFRLIPFWGKRKKLSYSVIIVLVLGYGAIAGFRPSVSRAILMCITILMAKFINRPYNLNNNLYLAALFLLFCQPLLLFDAGFLLSFTATFFIIFLCPIIIEQLKCFPTYISQPLSVSLAAWLGTAPLSAYFFYKVSYIALLANLLIVPLITIILILGFISTFISFLILPLAGYVSILNELFIKLLISLTQLFSIFPMAYQYVAQPEVLRIIYYYLLIILLALSINHWSSLKVEKKKKVFWAIVVTGVIFVIIPTILPSNQLTIHFLNVGQGDSILIQTPHQKNILIDGGGTPYSDFDIGKEVVIPYLRRQGVNKIDLLILSHPDLDHLEGLIPVLKEISVDMVLDSGVTSTQVAYKEFCSIIEKNNNISYYQAKVGDIIKIASDLEFIVLNSTKSVISNQESNFNNQSIVLKLIYNENSFLFTGDIEEEAESDLLSRNSLLKSDILKVAHHGSLTSSTELFLDSVQPKVAIISVGKNNFNHPHPETIERLEKYCPKLFRTDVNGTILIKSNGKKYYISTYR